MKKKDSPQVKKLKEEVQLLSDELSAIHDRLAMDHVKDVTGETVERADPLLRGVDVNPLGGRQSKINGRYDLFDWEAIHRLARVLELGAKKRGEQNWRLISRRDHLNHLLFHVANVLELMDNGHHRGFEEIEENMDRALCRAMMALGSRH